MLTSQPPTYDCDAADEPSCCECHGNGCRACEPDRFCEVRGCRADFALGEMCSHAQASDNENAAYEAAE